jgi:hypothetical protein
MWVSAWGTRLFTTVISYKFCTCSVAGRLCLDMAVALCLGQGAPPLTVICLDHSIHFDIEMHVGFKEFQVGAGPQAGQINPYQIDGQLMGTAWSAVANVHDSKNQDSAD